MAPARWREVMMDPEWDMGGVHDPDLSTVERSDVICSRVMRWVAEYPAEDQIEMLLEVESWVRGRLNVLHRSLYPL